jgi:serine/threonine protein kinase
MQLAQTGEALGASYRFSGRVGSGAVGEVWTVTAAADGRTLAAKVLRPEHADDPSLVERFVRERSVLLALQDPHIVMVRDMVVEGPRLAIIMDYVPGGSLRDALQQEAGALRPEDALNVTAEVFDALAAAHAGRRPRFRLRNRRRRGRTDPADHRPHRHPPIHAARAHQPGQVRPAG